MGKFVTGDIVVINFPYSDLSGAKRRPALVLANLGGYDILLCQITSRARTDEYSVKIEASDFISGNLSVESVVRPNKIFTADERIILYTACRISNEKTSEIAESVCSILACDTNTFPILEFDPDRDAFIRPERYIQPIDIPEHAVLCFFGDAIEKILAAHPHKVVSHITYESFQVPVYEVDYNGRRVVLVQAFVSAVWASGHLEDLTAKGCRKYIACGGCGVLQEDIAVGRLIVPLSAVRDEGVSYHYAKPSREVAMSEKCIAVIERTLQRLNMPFITGKTWTTDAFYRETKAKIARRKQEGCIAVDMEASAFFAVADYLGVDFGQIFYAGDSLAGDVWDNRAWRSREDIRESVLRAAIEICLEL